MAAPFVPIFLAAHRFTPAPFRNRVGASLLMATCAACASVAPAQLLNNVDPGEFDNVQYWVGSGANQGAVVIDFHDGKVTNSYAWGVRWDGILSGEDALRIVVDSDPRLVSNTQQFAFGLAVYGIYFDANGNGGAYEFTGSDGGSVEDPADHLQNGFLTNGFWGYSTTEGNPANDPWEDSMVGAGGRFLENGSWDGWAFAPGYNINPPRNPITFVTPARPFIDNLTLTDFTHVAPVGFTSQPAVSVQFDSAYGMDIRLSETSGGGAWTPLTLEPITFELSPGDGLKTVYATLRRENQVSDEVSATITLTSGYNFATVDLPMSNPTASDYLLFDVTYGEAVGEAFDVSDVAFAGTLAGIATVENFIDNDSTFRIIARLSDSAQDGTLAITVPIYDSSNEPVLNFTSHSYGVKNGAVQFPRGDYNRDGQVNVQDVTALANDIVNGVVD